MVEKGIQIAFTVAGVVFILSMAFYIITMAIREMQ
jgi:hypothetical protein